MRHLFQKPIITAFVFFLVNLCFYIPLSMSAQNLAVSVPIKIKTEQARAIKNATVAAFMDDTVAVTSGSTNAEGSLNMNLSMGGDYRVKVSKNDEPYVGVTTYDIAVLIRHIQGIEAIPTPYAMIAGDVDESGEIDGADIVHIRNFILRRTTALPKRAWRFVDKGYVFKDPSHPFFEEFPEYIDFSKVSKDSKGEFVAVKVGDVTAGFPTRPGLDNEEDEMLSNRNQNVLPIQIEDIQQEAGKIYKIAVNAQLFKTIAYQMALKIDKNKASVLKVEAADLKNLTDNNYAIMGNSVRISWDGEPTNNTTKLFYLTILAEENTRLSEILTIDSQQLRPVAFEKDGNPMKLRLDFIKNKVQDADVFTVFQNYPNPVEATTTIGFNLPAETFVRFSIYDNLGRSLKTINQVFSKGYNEISLNKADINAFGILHYRLETPQYSAIKKMLVVNP